MPFFSPTTQAVAGYVLLFLLVAPLFPFLYLVIRWRAEGRHEAGIGTHGALCYFLQVSVLLLLAALANLTYGWISTTEILPFQTRLSWGMFTSSVVFLVLNTAMLFLQRPSPAWRDLRRVFWGFLMVMTGLVALTTLVLFWVTYYYNPGQEAHWEIRADDMKLYGSWCGYFLVTYIASTIALTRGRP
ncbi:MAG: hypothetical protein OER88_05055 [Planctomycetota bacterium]|nr:hypothetical protein [Planctomycetota bacterium]